MYRGLLVALINGCVFTTSLAMEQHRIFFGNEIQCLRLQPQLTEDQQQNLNHLKELQKIQEQRDQKNDQELIKELKSSLLYGITPVAGFPKCLKKADSFATINCCSLNYNRGLQFSGGERVVFNGSLKKYFYNQEHDNSCDYKDALYFILLNEEEEVINVLSKTELTIMCTSTPRIQSMADFGYNDNEGKKIDGFVKLYQLYLRNTDELQQIAIRVCDITKKWLAKYNRELELHTGNNPTVTPFTRGIITGEIQELIVLFKKIQLPEKPLPENNKEEIVVDSTIYQSSQRHSWTPYIVIGVSMVSIALLAVMYRSSGQGMQKICAGIVDGMADCSFSLILDAFLKNLKRMI